jgi:hypothetical protein
MRIDGQNLDMHERVLLKAITMCKPRDIYSTQISLQPVRWEDIGGLDEAKVRISNSGFPRYPKTHCP